MEIRTIKDKILYSRLKHKDKEAFIKAYDFYIDDIYRFIYFKVNKKEEAEDLTSTVFLKTWNYIQNNNLTNYKTLRSLLYKIARNLVIDHYRERGRKMNIVSFNDAAFDNNINAANIIDENQNLFEKVELTADFKIIEKKIFELKDEYREVIILRYINELSITDIANILEKSRGNVRVLIYRALKALREMVDQR